MKLVKSFFFFLPGAAVIECRNAGQFSQKLNGYSVAVGLC